MAVILGGILMAIGHFALTFKSLFVVGLLFLVCGNGCFKPNISTQVGRLYADGDPRRDAAFSIFYGGINVGAMLSPLVCGSLGENVSYEAGFGAAGVGMCLGLTVYVLGLPWLAPDKGDSEMVDPMAGEARPVKQVCTQDWPALVGISVTCLFTIIFWAVFEQQGSPDKCSLCHLLLCGL